MCHAYSLTIILNRERSLVNTREIEKTSFITLSFRGTVLFFSFKQVYEY